MKLRGIEHCRPCGLRGLQNPLEGRIIRQGWHRFEVHMLFLPGPTSVRLHISRRVVRRKSEFVPNVRGHRRIEFQLSAAVSLDVPLVDEAMGRSGDGTLRDTQFPGNHRLAHAFLWVSSQNVEDLP